MALEFEDVEDYINSWTPLFLTEIKSQINREVMMEKEDSEKFVLEAIDEKVPFRYMTLMRKEGENKFYKIHDFALITYYEPEIKQKENLIAIVDSVTENTLK